MSVRRGLWVYSTIIGSCVVTKFFCLLKWGWLWVYSCKVEGCRRYHRPLFYSRKRMTTSTNQFGWGLSFSCPTGHRYCPSKVLCRVYSCATTSGVDDVSRSVYSRLGLFDLRLAIIVLPVFQLFFLPILRPLLFTVWNFLSWQLFEVVGFSVERMFERTWKSIPRTMFSW